MADRSRLQLIAKAQSRLQSVRTSPLARAAMITTLLTLICKVIGFAKELVIASQFGVGATLDAFLVAVVLPNLTVNVFAQNFAAVLVLKYINNQSTYGEEIARQRMRTSLFWGALFVLAISVAGVAFGQLLLPWLSPGFQTGLQSETRRLLWLLLPYSVFASQSAVWSAILNAKGRFGASAASPGVTSLGMIIAVAAFPSASSTILVAGLTAGTLLDLTILGWSLRREGLPILPRIGRWQAEQGWLVAHTLPLVIGSLLQFSTVIVDQSMASLLGEGSVSELNYGNRFVAMVIGLIALPMGRILFPHFVQLIESKRWDELRTTLRRSLLFLFTVTIPITLVLSLFSTAIVMWTFQRGQFTADMTSRVAAVQVMSALQIPFYLCSAIQLRLAVALRMQRAVVGCGLLNLCLNILLNGLLMVPLGVTGIALSTALVYLGASCYFSAAIRANLRGQRQQQPASDLESVACSTEMPPLAA